MITHLDDMLRILFKLLTRVRSKPVVAHSARLMIQHVAAARHPDQLARRGECGVVQLQSPVVVAPLPVFVVVEPISSRWQIGVLTVLQPT